MHRSTARKSRGLMTMTDTSNQSSLPGGLDPDDVLTLWSAHGGNIAAMTREVDVTEHTVRQSCIECGLCDPGDSDD